MKKKFKFEKTIEDRWYIVLPEWKGDKEELEMVAGADKLLDIIAKEDNHAYITISDEPFKDSNFTLVFDKPEAGGAIYNLVSEIHKFKVWLCHVTKFVFKGKLPNIIYCNV